MVLITFNEKAHVNYRCPRRKDSLNLPLEAATIQHFQIDTEKEFGEKIERFSFP
jgi:hypothetical protein